MKKLYILLIVLVVGNPLWAGPVTDPIEKDSLSRKKMDTVQNVSSIRLENHQLSTDNQPPAPNNHPLHRWQANKTHNQPRSITNDQPPTINHQPPPLRKVS